MVSKAYSLLISFFDVTSNISILYIYGIGSVTMIGSGFWTVEKGLG